MGQCPILGHCNLFGIVPRERGTELPVENEVGSYKKLYSHVHIRTSRKRKASGLQFGDFLERFLDRKKAVGAVEARIVSTSNKSPQTKPAIIGSAVQTGCT